MQKNERIEYTVNSNNEKTSYPETLLLRRKDKIHGDIGVLQDVRKIIFLVFLKIMNEY